MWAANVGNLEVVKLLLENGADAKKTSIRREPYYGPTEFFFHSSALLLAAEGLFPGTEGAVSGYNMEKKKEVFEYLLKQGGAD
jgi:ankyrin repeat protein